MKFISFLVLFILTACATAVENPFREGTGVWFILEGREVTAAHVVADNPLATHISFEDLYVGPPSEAKGFEIYDDKVECTVDKPFHKIYLVIPELGVIEGYIFQVLPEKYACKFDIPISPGFSGSPVLDFKTKKVLGLISGIAVTREGLEVTIVQRIEKEDING